MALFYNNLKLKMQKKDAFQRPNFKTIFITSLKYHKRFGYRYHKPYGTIL